MKAIVNLKLLLLPVLIIISLSSPAKGQSVRSLNNSGVDAYKKQQFMDAEVNFKKGLEKENENFELNYNLGDAYYKQERYEEAIKSFQNSLSHTEDGMLKAKAYHNIGNSLLKSQQIKESVEAFKNSLKHNPNDKDTKYNLSYALSLLNQQQQQQQNKSQNDKNQDNQNQNDQNKNNQQNKDEQKDQEQKQQNKDQTAQQDNLKQQEKDKMNKQEAERILEALKNNEKELQKKLRKKVGVPIKTDKDW